MITVLYVVLGLASVFVPGFLLSLVFFPRHGDLDPWERTGVSFGLGILALAFVAVVLAQPSLKMLEAGPFFGSVFLLSIICLVLAYWRGGMRWVIGSLRKPMVKPEGEAMEAPVSEKTGEKSPN